MEIIDRKTEHLPKSARRLTIRVAAAAIRTEYEQLLAEWQRTVRIDGFRKGKVPKQIIEHRFTKELRHNLEERVLTEAVRAAIKDLEQKPLYFSQPRLEDKPVISLISDLSFSVVYDVFPEISVGLYRGLTINVPTASVDRDDVEREIEILREQNATIVDIEKVTKGAHVTIEQWELDSESQPIESSRQSRLTVHVGSDKHPYKIERNLIGMRVGEERAIRKRVEGEALHIGLRVIDIKERRLPPTDNELAQDVSDSFKTLADLRADIRRKLQLRLDRRIREISENQILDQILQESKIELPESMVRVEQARWWNDFVTRAQMTAQQTEEQLKQEGTSKAELLDKIRLSIEAGLRKSLLISFISDRENISIDEGEVDDYINMLAGQNSMSPDRLRDFYRTNDGFDGLRSDLSRQKLFDLILAETTVYKGKRLKLLDLMENNQ